MPSTPNPWDYADKSGLEHAHQAALFMWANMAARFGLTAANDKASYSVAGHAQGLFAANNDAVPTLKWFHAIHNQGNTAGQAGRIHGAKNKAEGLKAGVFDMFLPVPMVYPGEFNGAMPATRVAGLYIELKVGKNQPSNEQLEFQTFVRQMGYRAEVAWGWMDARRILLEYLGLPVGSIT